MPSTPAKTSARASDVDERVTRVSQQFLVRGLTFDHLATLKAVVESGSFRRAAEKRLVSQPAVSQRVRQLEALVGVPLFDRQRGTSASLTAAGELMMELANQVLSDLDGFCVDVRRLGVPTTDDSLVVAAGPSFIKYRLLRVSRRLEELHPDLEIRLQRSTSPDDVLAAVLEHVADLGIYSGPAPSGRVRAFPLSREFLRLVAPPGHPMAAVTGSARISELSHTQFAISCDTAHSRQLTEAWARHYGIKLHVRIEADNLDTLKEAVIQGLAVAILPEFAIEDELASGALVPVELPGLPLERRVSVIAHTSNPLSATQRAFIDELVQTLGANSHPRADRRVNAAPTARAAR
jgi:DNA-binding transcriptional LysR family regulator